jgi:hypothetical protein
MLHKMMTADDEWREEASEILAELIDDAGRVRRAMDKLILGTYRVEGEFPVGTLSELWIIYAEWAVGCSRITDVMAKAQDELGGPIVSEEDR